MRGSFAGLSKIEWGAHGLVWAGIALILVEKADFLLTLDIRLGYS